MRLLYVLLVLVFSMLPLTAEARGGHGGGHSRSSSSRISEYHHRTYTPRVRSYTPREYHPRTYRTYSPRKRGSRLHSNRAWLHKYASNPFTNHGEYRSLAEKHLFWEQSGHPHGWPGHVVDHVTPLACGGADRPSNMQWQTIAEGKAKDKWERKGCKGGHRH